MDQGAKSYWAEFVGTFTLCFIGQGAICANELLGADGPGLLGIAVAHGLALAVMISAFGATSGGHLNPAVTFGFLVTGRQSLPSAIKYWISQLAGAVVASWLLTMVFPAAIWQAVRLGAAGLSPETTVTGGMIAETIMTFFLVTAVWGTAVDERAPRIGGFGIGLAVLMGILMGGPLTGAAMNPARAFGPALVAGAWETHWLWWVAPMLGGGLAALTYQRIVLGGRRG
jgi:MIP family channel proteins